MADIAAKRREARRRKLLMSSEDRLNRILQLNSQMKEEKPPAEESDVPRNEGTVDAAIEHTTPPEAPTPDNVSTLTQPSTLNQDHESSILSRKVSEKSLIEPSSDAPAPHVTGSTEETESLSQDVSPKHSGSLTPDPISPSPVLIRRTQAVTKDSEETVKHSESSGLGSQTIQQFEKDQNTPTLTPDVQPTQAGAKGQVVSGREVVCILLAIVMRIMLAYDWLTIYTGQSIMVPFVAVQLALAVLIQNKPKLEGGMMVRALSMALMLSKVPPQTISRLMSVMGAFAAVFADLALYLFTFITIHCVFEVCG